MRPLVEEAISLQEPIAPLCEPGCPGLCPECGERLEPGHGHGDGPIDPRLGGPARLHVRRRGRERVDSPVGPGPAAARLRARNGEPTN